MKRIVYMAKAMHYLVRTHKFYFLAPIFAMLCLFAILFFKVGPGVLISFIYAGV